MTKFFKVIIKYILLYFVFFKNCLIAQMEYRVNFIFAICVECAFLFSKILYLIVVFKVGVSINGLSPYAILMFMGSYTLITGIMDGVYFPNVTRIPQYVANGDLDTYITKPVSLQFLVSFRYFDFGLALPNVLVGIVMIALSWYKTGELASLTNILGYLFYTIIGVIVAYPILFIPALLSFWIVQTKSIYDIIWAMWDFNNMPMHIYGNWLQRFGIFIVPIFLITNFAPMSVMGMITPVYFVWAMVAPIIFIILFRLLWKFAIKNYSSASS